MKTFNQFKYDMNEGVASLAIPAGVGMEGKVKQQGSATRMTAKVS